MAVVDTCETLRKLEKEVDRSVDKYHILLNKLDTSINSHNTLKDYENDLNVSSEIQFSLACIISLLERVKHYKKVLFEETTTSNKMSIKFSIEALQQSIDSYNRLHAGFITRCKTLSQSQYIKFSSEKRIVEKD